MRWLPALFLIVALMAGCVSTDGNGPQKEKVVIAIQPTDNPGAIDAKAKELEAFLEAKAPTLDVEVFVPLSYSGVVEALRFGHADVALMSAWPSYIANKLAGAEIVLAEAREVQIGTETQVQPYYFSYYVVKKDSPFTTLADLRDKNVAYPSETSTSGYVYPVSTLVGTQLITKPAGKAANPDDFFGTVTFAGGYAQGWQALKNGQVDVTVIAGDVNRQLYFEVLDATRIVATQGPVPSHGVVFSKEFQGDGREALRLALLELKGEHKDLMRSLVSAIFVEFRPTTTTDHVASLQTALDDAGLKFQERLG